MNDAESPPPTDLPGSELSFRKVATDALRYWEPRRLLFNAALTAVVVGHFIVFWPSSRMVLMMPMGVLGLIILAVLANVCYCAAYIPDIFVQFTGYRQRWLRWRWLLLVLGIVFAGAITHFFALGLFAPSPGG